MKKNPPRWSVIWIACILSIVFFVTSCDPPKELGLPNPFTPKDQGPVLLATDLYLRVQWEKEMELTEKFYGQLDSLGQLPSLPGKVLTTKLNLFKKERRNLHEINRKLAEKRNRIKDPLGEILHPPKAPPPPPPVTDPDLGEFVFDILITRTKPPVLYFQDLTPDNSEIIITQGNTTVISNSKNGTQTDLGGGLVRVSMDISTLSKGVATLKMPGFENGPPVTLKFRVNE